MGIIEGKEVAPGLTLHLRQVGASGRPQTAVRAVTRVTFTLLRRLRPLPPPYRKQGGYSGTTRTNQGDQLSDQAVE